MTSGRAWFCNSSRFMVDEDMFGSGALVWLRSTGLWYMRSWLVQESWFMVDEDMVGSGVLVYGI